MKTKTMFLSLGLILLFSVSIVRSGMTHCDTMDGPVIKAAQEALRKGDVTPVLKWVQKKDEAEISNAFRETMAVRTKGPEAQELADRYFFETLVRVHRAGEGAPYTGLKPAGAVDPIIAAADHALERGSAHDVTALVTKEVASGIQGRFAAALETKQHADESVEAGRAFVEAYVPYMHYVEGIYATAQGPAEHHGAPAEHHQAGGCPEHAAPKPGAAHEHAH